MSKLASIGAPPVRKAPAAPAAVGRAGAGRSVLVGRTVLVMAQAAWLRDAVADSLRAAGAIVLPAAGAEQAQAVTRSLLPDAMVIDVQPGDSAMQAWLTALVAARSPVPSLLLGASIDQTERLADLPARGLDKPVRSEQVLAGLQHFLRRSASRRPHPSAASASGAESSRRVFGVIELSESWPLVRLHQRGAVREISLPRREHALLKALIDRPVRVQTREELRSAVWGQTPVHIRTVDQYVRRLRHSLDQLGLRDFICTVNTAGYRVEPAALPNETSATRQEPT
jgi:DNA-binding response OmpR family regulator